MLYFIEREFDIPFDKSFRTVTINNKIYDLIISNTALGLDSISEYIFDIDKCLLIKTNPRESNDIKKELKKLNYVVKELLLG